MKPSVLKFCGAIIDYKTHIYACGSEIIDDLGLMLRSYCSGCLELNYYFSFDKKVCKKLQPFPRGM